MALKGKTVAATLEKADAFLNLKIKDSKGNMIPLKKGLPLHITDALHKALIEAVKASPDKTFELTGTIQLVTEAEEKTYSF